MRLLLLILILATMAGRTTAQSWAWSKAFVSDGGYNTYITSLLTDSSGAVYAAGKFSQNISISKLYTGIGIFLVKLDKDGKILWEKVYTSAPVQYPTLNAVADHNGNIYLLGYCDHDLVSDNADKIPAGTFLLKFDKDGKLAKPNAISAQETTLCLSGSGKYLTTLIKSYGSVHIGTTTIADKGNLVIQTDTSGKLLWYQTLPTTLLVKSASTRSDGAVFVTGLFKDSVSYSNQKIKSSGDADAFLLKIDGGGRFQWLKGYGLNGFDQGLGVAFDAQSNIFLTGDKTYNAFNTNLAEEASFISEMDSLGNVLWGKETGDAAIQFPVSRSIAVDAKENIYFNGEFKSNLYLNWSGPGISLPHTGGEDAYAGMLPDISGLEWGLGIYGGGDEKSTSMFVDAYGNIGLAGTFTDSLLVGKSAYSGKGIFIARSFSNQVPVVQTFTATSAVVNAPYELKIYAQDPDSDSLFGNSSGLPQGFTLTRLDPKTFVIKGTAVSGQEGSYPIKLYVSDHYSSVESDFNLTIVSAGSAVPLALVYASLPLTGGKIGAPDASITYEFSNPIDEKTLVYQIGVPFVLSWSADGKTLQVSFKNLSDVTDYAGFISLSDSMGNNYVNNLSFSTNFSLTAVVEKEKDELLDKTYFDLQGRNCGKAVEGLQTGIFLTTSVYRSGSIVHDKIFIGTD